MISPNLRFLKLRDDGYYMRNGLCGACGNHADCSIKSSKTQVCTDYQPVIHFKSLAGTDSDFNTFRLGSAWSRRLSPGQKIGLLDRAGLKQSEAEVISTHCGPRQDMIDQHAHLNHLMLAKQPENPAAELARILRNLYGANFLAKAEAITVIYLRRLPE